MAQGLPHNVAQNPAALRAAVFFAIREKTSGGGVAPPLYGRGLIDYVPSHQGRAAIHKPECSLRSVACVLMHNNTIFPFLHLLLIYLLKWHKVFFLVRVTLCHAIVKKSRSN